MAAEPAGPAPGVECAVEECFAVATGEACLVVVAAHGAGLALAVGVAGVGGCCRGGVWWARGVFLVGRVGIWGGVAMQMMQ